MEINQLITGPAGNIELVITPPDTDVHSHVIAIVCHPHPLYGGTMNNKVVTTLVRTFRELGLKTVRFNFRGVGKSAGEYDKGLGETEDLLAIIDWLKASDPQATFVLAGFSFGSYVAARAATYISAKQLVSIAPPVVNFNFAELPPIECPWLIVQGEQDEVVDPEAVYAFVKNRVPPPQLIRIPNVGHFFHGRLIELREILKEQLSK